MKQVALEKETKKVRSLNLEMYGFKHRQLEKWMETMSCKRTLDNTPFYRLPENFTTGDFTHMV